MEFNRRKTNIAYKSVPNPNLHSRRSSTTISVNKRPKHKSKRVPVETYNKEMVLNSMKGILNSIKTNDPNEPINYRDAEITTIKEYITTTRKKKANDIDPNLLIIFGQPGLGKTRLMHQIVEELGSAISKNKKEPPIHFYKFNSMNYDNALSLITDIVEALFKIKVYIDDKSDCEYWVQIFRESLPKLLKKCHIGLLIDELDFLYYKSKSHFNQLLELLNINMKGFVKIGIANTLNFIGKTNGTTLSLNSQFLIFKPYSYSVLQQILAEHINSNIQDTLKNWKLVINESAMDYLCKKVVKDHAGDVRFLYKYFEALLTNKTEFIMKSYKRRKLIEGDKLTIVFDDISDILGIQNEKDKGSVINKLTFVSKVILLALFNTINDKKLVVDLKEIEQEFRKLSLEFDLEYFNLSKDLLENLICYQLVEIKGSTSSKCMVSSILSKLKLAKELRSQNEFYHYFETKPGN